ncbi:dicarboxylate/amino acid:cation symporter [Streptomyces radicis]|uniref:Dicarboxylate/amino acid:cation symporter n=1 Tax=Streptomyces radicis TaxID=1750517 RepID=A0A3A9VXV3_9ACTN|nr:dicarboxylate/amino acid:cation symporter [Streptomyces radicis]RKN05560.1 dicarboxylate/amino acid:cation symporter [Streptomyces radicis]RKN17429.1 dicarboxylate/amino acid:cation symporter [Streptomyces radicis]
MSSSSSSPAPDQDASPAAASRPRISLPPFWAQILLGLVLGALLGWIARNWNVDWLGRTLDEIGGIFVQLLQLAVGPLVFFAIAVSITNLRNVANAARLAAHTLLWFLATSLIAVAIGLTIGLLTNPGDGTGLTPADGALPQSEGSWLDFLTGIVPTDVISPFANLEVLQIVFLAAVTGVAALRLGDRAAPLISFGETVLELLQKALWWVIRLAPLGTLGLIGRSINEYGWDLIGDYATFTAGVYIGCALVLFGVYPLLLRSVAGLNPLRFFRGAWPAIQLAFVSRSSVGTLPVTTKVTERLGVPREYNSFAVPLGATTKMDGCAAIYPALAAIFVAEIFDVSLGAQDYLLIAFVSVIGSAATAGLTGATIMTTLTLSTLGLPLEGVGLLLAIDPILDMIRTATNVAGQAVVPVIVAARAKILDLEAYDSATSFEIDEAEAETAPQREEAKAAA